MGILKFKGSWRGYQKRILEALSYHFSDEKLHVVAAPGAGKTTLGIEVISRLNKATLILCPTNTIKNQWKERICNSFLDEEHYDIVSTDIREPKPITVITYQALLAAFMGKTDDGESISGVFDEDTDSITEAVKSSKKFSPEKADIIIKTLKKAKISVLCFDEAHHLRREWWKALTYLVEHLKPKQTLALTGTPPYDADPDEWKRYEELCGPIDEVISIPELVNNGDLCPHQDYIWFSGLDKSESEMVEKYNRKVGAFIGKIFSDRELFEYLKRMQFLNPYPDDVAKILEFPDFYVSIISILKSGGFEIPKAFLKIFDATQSEVPAFDLKQAKTFLNGFLITHRDCFPNMESKIEEYYNLAHNSGLVQNNKIVLNDSEKIKKQISNSIGKLRSIIEIVKIESAALGRDLRMVVLADYIRENDMDNSSLGVIPIWRMLNEEFGDSLSIGVLCGSVILLPKHNQKFLETLLNDLSLPEDSVTVSVYKENENYLKITPKESLKHRIVSLVTEMFNRGCVNVLVGTQSLLGEGWDAPCINSLILSSTVSSYMLSNQMRGRAIRVDKNNPNKVSNIWHLASVKIPEVKAYLFNDEDNFKMPKFDSSDFDILDISGANLYDLKQLEKRFEGYEAPSYFDKHEIMNGIGRVISKSTYAKVKLLGEHAFTDLNGDSAKRAVDRETTRKHWREALAVSNGKSSFQYPQMTTGVDVPVQTTKTLVYESMLSLFKTWCVTYWGTVLFLAMIVAPFFNIQGVAIFSVIITLVIFACSCVWFWLKYLKTGSVVSVLKDIAVVILETAYHLDMVKKGIKDYRVSVDIVEFSSSYYVAYRGLTVEDNNFLMKCLQELLDPIDNPRYILIKKTFAGLTSQIDYFSVPSAFSSKKSEVEVFKQCWHQYVGHDEVYYTRNYEGRRLLLKARSSAFSAMKRPESKKLTKWQ